VALKTARKSQREFWVFGVRLFDNWANKDSLTKISSSGRYHAKFELFKYFNIMNLKYGSTAGPSSKPWKRELRRKLKTHLFRQSYPDIVL